MSNIIQEVTAKNYICPMAMERQLPSWTTCHGDTCMAWRFSDNDELYGFCGMAVSPFFIKKGKTNG